MKKLQFVLLLVSLACGSELFAQTQAAQVDPSFTAPAAAATAAPDVSKAADDLSNSLDNLMKDLNSDDGLNDVK